MSIYDRARDAFNAWTNGTEHEKTDAAIELAKNSDAFAAEVVRLHEQFAALAGELEREVEDALRKDIRGDVAVLMGIQTSTKRQVAERIREVIERGKA